ncbi:MAG: peptide-methionine (R)-S-oxide reductase MsrB [Ignavibacteria bacterium]|jgi:peptide methionine sulfoxide reductase msrA/msrB
MIKWIDVLKYADNGNPVPDKRVEKTEDEWKNILTPEQFEITRKHGTERAFSGELCRKYEPGTYMCICCNTILFDSNTKFDSQSGWPSFTQPAKENTIKYIRDNSFELRRIEVQCNTCDAHLGHVFQDGPEPSGLRYCINSISIKHVEKEKNNFETVTIGGGCFWCVEAVFQRLRGVIKVESGYSGGKVKNPTYREICSGKTDHAEVVQITFNREEISLENIYEVFLTTHNPTSKDRQGFDVGTQYRSIILYHDLKQKNIAVKSIKNVQKYFDNEIVTEVVPFIEFFKAEDIHKPNWFWYFVFLELT